MNALVVHYSLFGNTRTVARAIAEALALAGPVHTVDAEQLSSEHLRDVRLVIVGTPTHKMNLPPALRARPAALPPGALRGVSVAAFDTSYRMSPFLSRFTAARRLARKLGKLGGRRLLPPETFHVEGREGPLCSGEVERARAWTETVLAGYGRLSQHQAARRG